MRNKSSHAHADTPPSLLSSGLVQRLAIAAAAVTMLWLITSWAIL